MQNLVSDTLVVSEQLHSSVNTANLLEPEGLIQPILQQQQQLSELQDKLDFVQEDIGALRNDLFSYINQKQQEKNQTNELKNMQDDLNSTFEEEEQKEDIEQEAPVFRCLRQPFYHKYKVPSLFKSKHELLKLTKPNKLMKVTNPFLPKNTSAHEYTLVLDLDQTLINSKNVFGDYAYSCYNTYYRPYLLEFLDSMSKHFEIVIFTAASQDYADKIINQIDFKKQYIQHRLYKQHMKYYFHSNEEEFVTSQYKDLSALGRDLSKTILIDDLEINFQKQPLNGIQIPEWRDNNCFDDCLKKLIPFLTNIAVNKIKIGQKHLNYRSIFQ